MTFVPKYAITDRILNNLTTIAAARAIIEQARLIPQGESTLRRRALLNATHSSTAIEGNKLTLPQVEALAAGQVVIAAAKDRQEVLNYLAALKNISVFVKNGRISVVGLLAMHRKVTRGALRDDADAGVFRSRQVFVGRRVANGTGLHEIVDYMPPPTGEVPKLVREFVAWLNSRPARAINPVLQAGITHYEIARIHPFIDGNGRTARLLATFVLYMRDFDHRRLFALDDYYDRDRPAYYAALKTVQQDEGDLTRWLEYFTTGVAASVAEVRDAIDKMGARKRVPGAVQIALTPRQANIIEIINARGKVANRELRAHYKISAQAMHKELALMTKNNIIKPIGKGRSLHYVLASGVDD